MASHACLLLILIIVVDFKTFVRTQYNMMAYQQPVNFLSEVTNEESKKIYVAPELPPAAASPIYSYPGPMLLNVPLAPLYAPGFSYFEPVVHAHPPVRQLKKYYISKNNDEDSSSLEKDYSEEYKDIDWDKEKDNRVMIIKNSKGFKMLLPGKSYKEHKKYKGLASYMDHLISKFDKVSKNWTKASMTRR